MQQEFIQVEYFYFAFTLAVHLLLCLEKPEIIIFVRSHYEQECDRPSIVATKQNTFNYVASRSNL